MMVALGTVDGGALEGRVVGYGGEDVVEIHAVVGREGGEGWCGEKESGDEQETQDGAEEHGYNRKLDRKRGRKREERAQ